ncbi:DUF4232 domain-containing protein [Streptomyces sp. NBC_01317]|uniref:DUF4232 domain-containing protein n=1 Tax=Streptomyces sp. NBC_01317 TaxID=2903822 RepID=UPI002E14CBBA|nr:DUF4232 domain-containing protein [Streptomyces sp. NBC_01317]
MTENEETFPVRPRSAPARHGRGTRLAAGGALVVAVAALLTGCGGKDDPAASAPHTVGGPAVPVGGDPSGTAAPDPDTTASGTASTRSPTKSGGTSGSPTHSGGTSTSAGGGRCHTPDVKASVGPDNPGAGQENFALVLTNTSGHTCTVDGFPGLAFLNKAGQHVSVDPERASVTGTLVKLAPGRSAWAPMTFGNPEITGVTTVTPVAVLITPPDEKDALKVAWTGGGATDTGKASVPTIGVFTAGTGA